MTRGVASCIVTDEAHDALTRRALGVLLGQACGDALGVPYEFGALPLGERAAMVGGGLGGYAPGEWSDDTQMALCIARVAATGADLTSDEALDDVATLFEEWFADDPPDVGAQTRAVLGLARDLPGRPATRLREASRRVHQRTGRSAGNGALMRTAVVALTALDDRTRVAAAAASVAALTHHDPLAAESCVLWSEAVRVAVTTGELHVDAGLDLVPAGRRAVWRVRLDEALDPATPPARFRPNGFTVTALQAAVSAIRSARGEGDDAVPLTAALQAAVRIGDDTDTVAAIAGGLLGAAASVDGIPPEWADAVHGWPGPRAPRDWTQDDLRTVTLDVLGASDR